MSKIGQTMVHKTLHRNLKNRISIVMVSVFTSNAVGRGFDLRSGQTKDYKIGICCFSAIKHTALRRKEHRLVGSESG